MFGKSKRINRMIHRPYYVYHFLDNNMLLDRCVVPQDGSIHPAYGKNEYPLPHSADQKTKIDNLETWVFVNVQAFEPLHTTPQPEWQQHPALPIARLRAKEKKENPTDDDVKHEFDMFIKRFQHFNPFVVRSFSEAHSTSKVLAGKPDKWAALVPAIIICALGFTAIMIVYLITSA